MVPRVTQRVPQAEWQQQQENGEEAGSVARIHERHGRLENALVRARQVDERGDARVYARAVNGMEVCHAYLGRHGAQHEHRAVGRIHARVGLRLRHVSRVDHLVELGAQRFVVGLPAEEAAQRPAEACRVGRQPPLELPMLVVVGEEGVRLPDHVATVVDYCAPQCPCLVPARVSRVGAEHEQQRERGHEDGERQRRETDRFEV
mmetsp:Transcript_44597/g.60953  ORF Transcript_44597/g.60953 Transcript_44597/m.60953 type:complete len:204 (-) Transcript_44597:447-1058(-)